MVCQDDDDKGNDGACSVLSRSVPTIPLDLIVEILCRLTVKLVVQFRCVCKSWNSVILSLKFVKKYLGHSSTQIHTLTYSHLSHKYVLNSFFKDDATTYDVAQLATILPTLLITLLALAMEFSVLLITIMVTYSNCGTLPLENSRNYPDLISTIIVITRSCMASAMIPFLIITRWWLFYMLQVVVVVWLPKLMPWFILCGGDKFFLGNY
jgi:hypothetical protein